MKKIFLLAAAMVMIVIGVNAKTQKTKEVNSYSPDLYRSMKALGDGENYLGYGFLNDLSDEDSDNAMAQLMIAYIYKDNLMAVIGIEYVDKAIELYEQGNNKDMLTECYQLKAECLSNCGLYEEALEYLNKVLEAKPNDAEVYLLRASEYENLENYDAMVADAQKALELDPDKVEAYLYLATGYEQNEDYANAIEMYNKYLESDDIDAESSVFAWRGNGYLMNGEYENAADDFVKVIDLAMQGDTNGMYYWDSEKMAKEHFDLMDSKLAEQETKNPDEWTWRFMRGDFMVEAGKYVDGINYLIELNKTERNGDLSEHIANLFALRGDYENALKYIDEAIELESYGESLYADTRAGYLNNLGRSDEVIRYYTERLVEDPYSSFDAVFHRSEAYELNKEYEKAIEDYSLIIDGFGEDEAVEAYEVVAEVEVVDEGEAVEEDEDIEAYEGEELCDDSFRISRGALYRLIGKEDLAIEDFKTVIEKGEYGSNTAMAHAYLGEKEKALEVLEDLVENDGAIYSPVDFTKARIYALVGENDKAMKCLEDYFTQEDEEIELVKVENCPDFEPLRNLPKYKELIAKRKQDVKEFHDQIKN